MKDYTEIAERLFENEMELVDIMNNENLPAKYRKRLDTIISKLNLLQEELRGL